MPTRARAPRASCPATGPTVWIDDETRMDAVTAVSGSGPAYFFLLMEAMVEAAIRQGLSADAAHILVLNTALGAARMANESKEESPATLRARVTSPGGTTQAALERFEAGGFRDLVDAAIARASRTRPRIVEPVRRLSVGHLANAGVLIVQAVFGLLTGLFFFRLLMQGLRVDFQQPAVAVRLQARRSGADPDPESASGRAWLEPGRAARHLPVDPARKLGCSIDWPGSACQSRPCW